MDPFIKEIQQIKTVEDAINKLKTETEITPKLNEIINFIIVAHEGQYRKSGEPYSVHPILVACITAHFSKDDLQNDNQLNTSLAVLKSLIIMNK